MICTKAMLEPDEELVTMTRDVFKHLVWTATKAHTLLFDHVKDSFDIYGYNSYGDNLLISCKVGENFCLIEINRAYAHLSRWVSKTDLNDAFTARKSEVESREIDWSFLNETQPVQKT